MSSPRTSISTVEAACRVASIIAASKKFVVSASSCTGNNGKKRVSLHLPQNVGKAEPHQRPAAGGCSSA
jgi:hypothetical protein